MANHGHKIQNMGIHRASFTETKSKKFSKISFWERHRASFTETKSSGIFRKNHSDLGLHKVVKDSWNNRSWKVLSRNV